MKKIVFALFLFSFAAQAASAQIVKPVKWSFAVKRSSATEAVVLLKATIDPTWHIYSQHTPDGGPVKTAFTFKPAVAYRLSGVTTEPKPAVKFEKAFGINVSYFEGSVIFQQKLKLKANKGKIAGTITYMVCNSEKCLPPEDLDFNIDL